ncbi:MAG: 4-hydroxy-tetrahydrodipicolinate synthase [Gammaproteobacteria bacterium]|nr:4-hydroxy-tetrahydrodipicolinate synthase [Gammaproteobacteria bacterium]
MFAGSMVALVTPMTVDGAIDFPSLEELIEFHIGEGTDALVVAGTTGESASLDHGELKKLVHEAIRVVRGRLPVICGSGSASTSKALILTRLVGELGADAALVMTPPYVKPTQGGLEKHYLHLADGADVPIILYNVPSRSACDLLPETVGRLSAHPGIIGIKEATGDVDRVKQILELADDGFEVYSGDDITAAAAMLAGARGTISVTANVAPALMHEMCDAALAGDTTHTAELNARLADLHEALFFEPNPIPVKWALADMGQIPEGIRLPLTRLSDTHHLALREAMRKAHII